MERQLKTDLKNIFDFVDTGHRHDGCQPHHIREYFVYLVEVALKYKVFNVNKIDEFINKIQNEKIDPRLDNPFFIMISYRMYEDELIALVTEKTNILETMLTQNLSKHIRLETPAVHT